MYRICTCSLKVERGLYVCLNENDNLFNYHMQTLMARKILY